jgi:hypothetical protein
MSDYDETRHDDGHDDEEHEGHDDAQHDDGQDTAPATAGGWDHTPVRVRMIQQAQHPRHDGRAWPAPGEEFEVPAWEADMLTHVDDHHTVPVAARVRSDHDGGPQIETGDGPDTWTVPAGGEHRTGFEPGPPRLETASAGAAPRVPRPAKTKTPAARVPAAGKPDTDETRPAALASTGSRTGQPGTPAGRAAQAQAATPRPAPQAAAASGKDS